MRFEDTYRSVTERVDTEKGVLLVMILSSSYMIWESYNFSIQAAGRFPRITAGAVVIGSLLLFFQDYLPAPLKTFVTKDVEMLEADEEFTEREEEAASEREQSHEADSAISTVGRPIHDSLFTALSAIGYALLGYTIGLLWATPIFVIAYTLWFRRPWYQVVGLSFVGYSIAYVFMMALGVPMYEGEIIFQNGLGVF